MRRIINEKKYICNKIFHNKSDSVIALKHVLKERIEKSVINNQYEPLSSEIFLFIFSARPPYRKYQ